MFIESLASASQKQFQPLPNLIDQEKCSEPDLR